MVELKQSAGSANLYNFLKSKKSTEYRTPKFKDELEAYIKALTSYSDDPYLIQVLKNFGWSFLSDRFERDIDIAGLRLALSKRAVKLLSRASQIGSKTNSKSYVPAMLIAHLANMIKNNVHAISPTSFFFEGVCLVVDISGFTRLSGSFCALGKNGIDELQKATSGYMGQLVEVIYSFGGDIIKFAGDAIICVFLPKDNKLASASNADMVGMSPREAASPNPLNSTFSSPRMDSNTTSPRTFPSSSAAPTPLKSMKFTNPQAVLSSSNLVQELVSGDFDDVNDKHDSEKDQSNHEMLITSLEHVSPNAREACHNALLCALELRDICTDTLTVHVAVSYGPMCFGILGGKDDKWECLIAGECITQISQCLDDAPSKNIAITRDFASILGPDILRQFRAVYLEKTTNYIIKLSTDELKHNDSILSQYHAHRKQEEEALVDWSKFCDHHGYIELVDKFVPMPVILGIQSSGINFMGEIREVTTMFMKWDSYNLVDYPDLISLQNHLLTCQNVIFGLGGFVRQFLVDDKGCVLIACWGVPTASFLDNATRALRAAVLIRQEFATLRMLASFGITTGNVYCGNVGSELRREYAAVGDVVNLSARLMSKAKHGIYIDEPTYTRLPLEVNNLLVQLQPIQVKGKVEPILVYSFQSEEIPKLAEAIIEDYEIKQATKIVLTKHLDQIFITNLNKINSLLSTLSNSNLTGSGGGNTPQNNNQNYSTKQNHLLHNDYPPLKFIVLEGKVGTGKETAAKWFSKEALKRDLKVISVNLEQKDSFIEYRLLNKIFKQYIKNDNHGTNPNNINLNMNNNNLNMFQVRSIATHIMREIYGRNKDYIDRIAMPAFRIAFGMNFPTTLQNFGEFSIRPERRNSMQQGGATSIVSGSQINRQSVPPRMILDTIRDVFNFLLNELPTVLIIENIQYGDEDSLKALLALQDLKTRSIVMLTMLNAESYAEYRNLWQLKYATASYNNSRAHVNNMPNTFGMSTVGMTIHQDATTSLEWLDTFRHILLQYSNTVYVQMGDYNVSEIDAMLRVALKTTDIPLGLPEWIHQLSGGSIFWISEMIEFLKSTSPGEFMRMIESQPVSSPRKNLVKNGTGQSGKIATGTGSVHSNTRKSVSVVTTTAGGGIMKGGFTLRRTASGTGGKKGGATSRFSVNIMNMITTRRGSVAENTVDTQATANEVNGMNNKFNLPKLTIPSSPSERNLSINVNGGGPSAALNAIYGTSDSVSVNPNDKADSHNKSKLDLFIICRFERLPLDLQKILKIASVIGYEFSRFVLYGILSNSLKSIMYQALKHLIKEHWIMVGDEADDHYNFSHPLIYDTLYSLTPSSDRMLLHKAIAEYYESMNPDDPKLFYELARHYYYFDENKSFEYAMKNIEYSLVTVDELDVDYSVALLYDSVKYCKSVIDVETIVKMIEKTREAFYESQENQTTGLSNNVNESDKQRKSSIKAYRPKPHPPTGLQPRPTGCLPFLCGNHVGAIVPYGVGEGRSAKTKEDRDRENSVSLFSSTAVMVSSSNLYTEKGKDFILRSLNRLERHLGLLLQQYEDEGKVGAVSPWQIRVRSGMGLIVLNESSKNEDASSYRSKSSWTFRGHGGGFGGGGGGWRHAG